MCVWLHDMVNAFLFAKHYWSFIEWIEGAERERERKKEGKREKQCEL